VHDLVGGSGEYISNPSLHETLIQITAPSMSNRIVTRPAFNGDGITNDEAIATRPTRAERLKVWVTSFEVNCYLLGCG
jgi:hypothetical protein